MKKRVVEAKRKTRETSILIRLNVDGQGKTRLKTGVPFFEHMLDCMARQALFDLDIKATGDLRVDYHHLLEDLGLCLGDALAKALGDKAGIRRYGMAEAPMDEALVRASLDLSGRPHLADGLDVSVRKIKDFDTQLLEEFLRAFVDRSRMTLHLVQSGGRNNHHILEAAFKALGLALRQACERDPRRGGAIPSTKGTLTA